MTLDVEIAYLKVPWLSQLEKFFFYLIWDHLEYPMLFLNYQILIWNLKKKTISDGDMTYAEVLVLGTSKNL